MNNRAIIVNYETGKKIHEMDVKGFEFRDVAKEIEAVQEKEDILGIGKPCKIINGGFGLGIGCYYKGNGYCSTLSSPSKDCAFKQNSDGSIIIGKEGLKKEQIPNNIKIETEDGNGTEDVDLKLGVIIYKCGLILSIGKKGYNILGMSYDAYIVKFTRTKVISGAKDAAKVFGNPKSVIKYLEEHEREFKYLVENYGYQLSVEYATPEYEKLVKSLPAKKLAKYEEDLKVVKECLELLNEGDEASKKKEPEIPEEADAAAIDAEAVYRMKEMYLMSEVIKNYNNKILMMSEGAGILYYLNENAKKAVEEAREAGLTPYHVVRSYTEFGELYDVLYVSGNTEEWSMERPNKGYVDSLCYNSSGEYSEYGSIRVTPCNGGLKRTE